MKFVSWNVNGLRACMGKGFMDSFKALDADFFCLQETKLQEGQITMELPGYHQYWCYAEKKGYSGTAIFTRFEPQSVAYGIGVEELDTEGRVITLEYPEFYLVTCYTPNAQRGLARIEHRMKWEEAFREYLKGLDEKKPVILCGDLNVAHKEIDLKNPSSNRGNAGFSDEERGAFTALLDAGFTDSFRHLYPDTTGAYSWWSYMFNARQNNAGWRIDYFVVSDRLAESIHDATIHPDILGSDHCPVGLDLNITCNGGIWIAPPEIQEQPDNNDADGTNSVGISRILLTLAVILVGAATIALLLWPAPKPEGTPTASTVVIPQKEPVALIKDVIDRSGNCYWDFNVEDPYSSSFAREYFVCGDEKFLLVPETVWEGLEEDKPIYEENFYLQVVFSEGFSFNNETKPIIQWKNTSYTSFEYTTYFLDTRYYYGTDGNIAGCFLYGYCLRLVDIEITARTEELYHSWSTQIRPHFDFDSMTTYRLLSSIRESGMIQGSLLSSSAFSLDDLIDREPLLQELLTRGDAIRQLLDSDDVTLRYLLSNDRFQALMTTEELEEYQGPYDPSDPLDSTISYPAISSVWHYLDNLEIGYSQEDQMYTLSNGQATWKVLAPSGLITGQDCVIPTFFLRMDFETPYSISDAENLSFYLTPPRNDIRHLLYCKDDKIKGIFLYGYAPEATELDVLIGYKQYITSQTVSIKPNFINLDTMSLIQMITTADALLNLDPTYLPPEMSWRPTYTLDDFIVLAPVQKLLGYGNNGINIMLDLYDSNEEIRTGADLLLSHPAFQELMDDEQRRRYESLTPT